MRYIKVKYHAGHMLHDGKRSVAQLWKEENVFRLAPFVDEGLLITLHTKDERRARKYAKMIVNTLIQEKN